jgi:L-aspartate oxidase
LFAAGEVACTGVHGANRLASNSLLEALVFGARAGAAMREETPASVSAAVGAAGSPEPTEPEISETDLRALAWEYCGISRNRQGLETARDVLSAVAWKPMRQLSVAAFERRNLVQLARLIAESALWREESRGAHYRTDFPESRPEFVRDSVSGPA